MRKLRKRNAYSNFADLLAAMTTTEPTPEVVSVQPQVQHPAPRPAAPAGRALLDPELIEAVAQRVAELLGARVQLAQPAPQSAPQPVSVGAEPLVAPRKAATKPKPQPAATQPPARLPLAQRPPKQARTVARQAAELRTADQYRAQVVATGKAEPCPWCAARGVVSKANSVTPRPEGDAGPSVKVKFAACQHSVNVYGVRVS